ncbi:LmeA family phospholipid-binding protein [Anaeroarcus burkinensis]|uniref:LmeA family phospholipid-binding protein n=1 Tax=Anaeroarcus burkinensis TaxID=82376 RepID=UPI0003FD5DBA|nr:LmeA family phospholipid-binding protein [Anaeroarcus burkinensis]
MRKTGTVLAMIAAVLILLELVLPATLNGMLEASLTKQFEANNVEAETSGRPALFSLTGRIPRLQVTAVKGRLDRLAFEDLSADIQDARIDLVTLLQSQRISLRNPQKLSVRMAVSEESLAELLRQEMKGFEQVRVQIHPEKIDISGAYGVGGVFSLPLQVEGRVETDGDTVRFVPSYFKVGGRSVRQLGSLGGKGVMLLDVKRIAVPLLIADIQAQEGRLTIIAKERN